VLTFPGAARKPVGNPVIVDLARECTDSVVGSLREMGMPALQLWLQRTSVITQRQPTV
jgi:hypothetical protein